MRSEITHKLSSLQKRPQKQVTLNINNNINNISLILLYLWPWKDQSHLIVAASKASVIPGLGTGVLQQAFLQFTHFTTIRSSKSSKVVVRALLPTVPLLSN